MKLYYDETADLLTIRFNDKDYGRDLEIEEGKAVLTFATDGSLPEIQVFEASKNGDIILSYSNLNIGQEKAA
ncbi:MAG: DUF2283 domain-containing protein [SAR324 cluster bacterium]|nr:DUF2283 domain-containing protein [SAR324 cluster bacterium]